jgi:hypothetical protein
MCVREANANQSPSLLLDAEWRNPAFSVGSQPLFDRIQPIFIQLFAKNWLLIPCLRQTSAASACSPRLSRIDNRPSRRSLAPHRLSLPPGKAQSQLGLNCSKGLRR